MWGEWKLTVSWTRDTYVDGELVKHEAGGWAQQGKFTIPGMASTASAPDGLWKRLGFSNASHGARKVALQYKLPAGGGPVDAIIHVTRPSTDPVTTVPFALRMVEGPKGFTFTEAPKVDCPPGPPLLNLSSDPVLVAPPPAANPSPQTQTRPPKPPVPVEDLMALEKKFDHWQASDAVILESMEKPQVCPEGEDPVDNVFGELQTVLLFTIRQRLAELDQMVPTGPLADGIREAITAERQRLQANLAKASAMKEPRCPGEGPRPAGETPQDPPKEPSILDTITEVPVIS
jgi:hypothetical protein